jgi:DNA-binding YbaB/EbfC family protein
VTDEEPIAGELVPESPAEGGSIEDALSSLGGPGGLDLGAMVQMAQDMGSRMQEAQERLATTEVEGTAGGGVVSVTLNGHLHVLGVHIDPSVIDPSDPAMLEDLVVAAWTDAHDRVARLQAEADPLGGMGGLGGLLGGA